MEGGGEEPGSSGWAPPGDGQFQAHSTTDVYTSQPQQQVFPSTSQGVVSSFADSQFQAVLAQGNFQHVYQQQAAAQPAGYDRISPVNGNVMEYPTSASTSSADNLQQFRVQSTDGAQIIRLQTINDGSGNPQPLVTVLLSNNTLATAPQVAHHLEQMMPVSMATSSMQPSHSMSLTTLAAAAALPSSASVMETDPSQPIAGPSSMGISHPMGNAHSMGNSHAMGNPHSMGGSPMVREVAQLEADSAEQVVSHSMSHGVSHAVSHSMGHALGQSQEELLQVVTSLHQPESTTSEAIPVGHQESDHPGSHMSLNMHKVEVYSSEPDTTQEELGQSYSHHLHHHHHHHQHHRHPAYNEPHSSGHQPHDHDLGHPSSMETGHMVSVPDGSDMVNSVAPSVSMASVNVPQPNMDPSIDTSGIIAHTPGGADNDLDLLVSGQAVLHVEPVVSLMQNNHLPQPGVSHEDAHQHIEQVRKSLRLASLEAAPARYQPQPIYNTAELWCEDCKTTYQTECPKHRQQEITDKVVLSRAWASLPNQLQIFRLGELPELGVFARKPISNRTQFGPFIAELVQTQEELTVNRFILQLERPTGQTYYLEVADENKCNWMMFVRPATTWGEQNLIAYQYNNDIYYTTIKNIEPKQELKVWYAAHYAHRLGVTLLEPQDETSMADRWPCYECNERFKTSAQLQKHLAVHDDNPNAGTFDDYDDDDNDPTVTAYARSIRRRSTAAAAAGGPNSRATVAKKTIKTENAPTEDQAAQASAAFQNWKKKKTSIYLNKYKKYHQETIKKSIKSLYKKKGKECGGQEWVCTHCDLTFDNSSLLNLHTLTHAAEDIGLQEIQKLCGDSDDPNAANDVAGCSYTQDGHAVNSFVSQDGPLRCPVCHEQFENKGALILHVSEHGKAKKRGAYCFSSFNPNKPHKCSKCWKAFTTKERLTKHMLCHGDEDLKPLQCSVCNKRFMNNSALACHLKTHSDKKYYECPLCRECFDQVTVMKSHVVIHCVNGAYKCPECHKTFTQYSIIRKHMRAFHSEKKYPCPECDKIFPRPDKLKLHMLRHSQHREFMCETCGRQFKRKDKLKEHIKRMHGPDHDRKARQKVSQSQKKFIPKVSPNDYHRFIYKCHTCLLGFKRRGMLVNHLAKRHPDMRPEHVPELNLPILRTQRDYYCQYCEKVYKSSSKRKAHIMKNHPGSDLPISSRKGAAFVELPGLPNPTYSQTVGSVTTIPHPCEYCHKQYASKAKLLQHKRKKHSDMVPPARRQVSVARVVAAAAPKQQQQQAPQQQTLIITTPAGDQQEQYVTVETTEEQAVPADPQADLLTQAMSELTQTLTLDYRNQVGAEYEAVTTQRIASVIPSSTIELSHLGQTLSQTTYQQVTVPVSQQQQQGATVSIQTLSPQSLSNVMANAQQVQHVPTSETEQTATPVSLTGATVSYIPRSWTTPTTNYR